MVAAGDEVDPGNNPRCGLNGDSTSSMTDAFSTFANLDDNGQNLPTGFLRRKLGESKFFLVGSPRSSSTD